MDFLIPHTGTIFWMLLSFLVVFYVLKKFAWKPILNALKQREESIKEALRSAENAKAEMQKLQTDNEAIIAEGKAERDNIIKDARELKDEILAGAKTQAEEESKKMIEDARQNIRNEKALAIKELKDQVASLSVLIAEKLLQEKLSGSEEQKELIDKMMKDIKVN